MFCVQYSQNGIVCNKVHIRPFSFKAPKSPVQSKPDDRCLFSSLTHSSKEISSRQRLMSSCVCVLALPSGGMCPFRHISGEKTVVCKHWLRGLCKKGDQCEFLHEYDMTKMPECYFYSKFGPQLRPSTPVTVYRPRREAFNDRPVPCLLSLPGECSNKECPFLHIDPESKIKDCPWYDRGFCKHGGSCPTR